MYMKIEAPEELRIDHPDKPITPQELFEVVTKWLDKHDELWIAMNHGIIGGVTVLDYCLPERWNTEPINNDCVLVEAVVNTGGNEGVYIDWRALCEPYGRAVYFQPIGTLKTLGESYLDYAYMGQLAGKLTYLSDYVLSVSDYKEVEKER